MVTLVVIMDYRDFTFTLGFIFKNQKLMFQVFLLTWASSSVLRFSRWMSHGSDELSGRNGRSFGSLVLLWVTMVTGGWQRESEDRWASSDKWSTEAPPTSCQKTNKGKRYIKITKSKK